MEESNNNDGPVAQQQSNPLARERLEVQFLSGPQRTMEA